MRAIAVGGLGMLALMVVSFTGAGARVAPTSPGVERPTDYSPVQAAIDAVAKGDLTELARSLAYPPSMSAEEKAEDQSAVRESLQAIQNVLGAPSSPIFSEEPLTFYEIGVFGGTVNWWAKSPNAGPMRQYLITVHFATAGSGILKILTSKTASGQEQPVVVAVGIPTSNPDAETILRPAWLALLDLAGVPSEHPLRSQRLPAWSAR